MSNGSVQFGQKLAKLLFITNNFDKIENPAKIQIVSNILVFYCKRPHPRQGHFRNFETPLRNGIAVKPANS